MKLIGKANICSFMGRSWPVVEKLILNESFPAECVGGVWQADPDQITTWRLSRPKAPLKQNSEEWVWALNDQPNF